MGASLLAVAKSIYYIHTKWSQQNQVEFFWVRQVYFTNSCQQKMWVRANQPFILFHTSHLKRKSTMRHCFYHTDLVQSAVFHNFSRQIAFNQYSGPSKHALACEQQTHFRSSLFSLRKIASAISSSKTIFRDVISFLLYSTNEIEW